MDKPRTLDEIKNDIRSRVGHRSPFNHADKQEAEEALAQLTSVDGETWASARNELAEGYEEKTCKEEDACNGGVAKDAYLKAFGDYGIGRHPFPCSPGKQYAYQNAREMHLAVSRYFEIPLVCIAIPFQGKEIV